MVAEEEGVLESLKGGVAEGAMIGVIVGSARSFLYSSDFHADVAKKLDAAKAANPNISRSALKAMTPTPLPALFMTTAAFAGITGVFTSTRVMFRNVRGKDDVWNGPLAGAVAGSLAGLKRQSLRLSAGCSASLFFSTLFFNLIGGDLSPTGPAVSTDRNILYAE